MTECYDPYENAVAKRVNGILKQEFLLETQQSYLTWMKQLVQQSVKIYNQERPHFSLYMQTPENTSRRKQTNKKNQTILRLPDLYI